MNCKTEPIFVPAGTTSTVQPVDVVFNKPFKQSIDEMATVMCKITWRIMLGVKSQQVKEEFSSPSGSGRPGRKYLLRKT